MSTSTGHPDYQALLKEGYRQLTAMRQRVAVLERSRNEPIAIVGMGCRFPGGGTGPGDFWRMLLSGVDAGREIPSNRYDIDAWYDPDPNKPGRMYVRRAALLDDVDHFDAGFFGISPREVASMDPQQRLLLEVAWEAIEDAGFPRDALAGTATGVYVGVMFYDYAHLIASAGLQHIDTYYGTGNGVGFLAGRLSYYLGLSGPSLVLDSACSSSLVAVHMACQSLRIGETNLALACGVNLILSPLSSVVMCRLRALAPDGRCKTFDAAADGYARGEGCGVVVLKRLSDALAAGDRIWAVIRGSAVNQNGAGAGITVPNGLAQQAVIRKALAEAKVEPKEIGYVEAHGTGTRLGDPLELRSLWSVLKHGRDASSPIVVGSLKTNVGHMEGAAGIGALIKTAMALRYGCIPPHLHVKQLNPLIAEEGIPLQVPQQLMPWPKTPGGRIAGVSSFGMSGTNAHMIVEAAPAETATSVEVSLRPQVLCLSARSEGELRELASRYCEHFRRGGEGRPEDICFTASAGRTHWDHRLAILADDAASYERKLGAWLEGRSETGVLQGKASSNSASAVPESADPEQVARLYISGARVNWAALYKNQAVRKVSLPTYPFNRQRYWVDIPEAMPSGPAESAEPLEGLLYEIQWRPQELAAEPSPADHACLVFADEHPVGRQLEQELRRRAVVCQTVKPATLDSARPEEFDRVIRDMLVHAKGQPLDVVYLWGLEGDEPLTAETLRRGEQVVWCGLLHLMQAVARVGTAQSIRLWVVTRSVHTLREDDRRGRPSGAGLWGLGKGFSLEHPELWGGLVDLASEASAEDAWYVLAEMAGRRDEDQMAYRQGRRHVARLEPLAKPLPTTQASIDPQGVYWITGGLGAVGLQTAEWLVQRGARCLVLQGRTGLPRRETWTGPVNELIRRRIEAVRKLEAAGVAVHVLAADVAGADFVAKATLLLEQLGLPLAGVFHAAGVSVLRPLVEMTADELRGVLAAKVTGLWNLYTLTASFPAAKFVCFSSIASVWGSRSLAHYAAANQFMDAFMQYRRARGLHGLSVNWGPLAGGGMDLEREEARLRRLGIRPLSTDRVGAILGRLLGADRTQVTAVDVDWSVFKPVYEAQRPRPLLEAMAQSPGGNANAAAPDRQRLLALDASGRQAFAQAYLLAQTAAVLQVAESDLDPAEPLTAWGVDSLMAMELQKRLQTQLGVEMPIASFLQGEPVGKLAERIVAGLDTAAAGVQADGTDEMLEGEL